MVANNWDELVFFFFSLVIRCCEFPISFVYLTKHIMSLSVHFAFICTLDRCLHHAVNMDFASDNPWFL